MSKIKINGKERDFDALPENLLQLLERLDIRAETVVAEIDGQIVERDNFAQTKLGEGQTIELVRFVPGG